MKCEETSVQFIDNFMNFDCNDLCVMPNCFVCQFIYRLPLVPNYQCFSDCGRMTELDL